MPVTGSKDFPIDSRNFDEHVSVGIGNFLEGTREIRIIGVSDVRDSANPYIGNGNISRCFRGREHSNAFAYFGGIVKARSCFACVNRERSTFKGGNIINPRNAFNRACDLDILI